MARAKKTTPGSRPKARKGPVVSRAETPEARLELADAYRPEDANAAVVLADGTVFWGRGFGAGRTAVGEVCFNTSITGYQEILTDPSYAGQIITFTFPHVGNVGTNPEDIETASPAARGLIVRAGVTEPSSWRASEHLERWLLAQELPGIAGVDTRALTARIRDLGAPNGAIGFNPKGRPDTRALHKEAAAWPGLEGMDLARDVTCSQTYSWDETSWTLGRGYGALSAPRFKVVAIDYGAKRNILRCLAAVGCAVTVVRADATAADILGHKPDGVFLSNGPGDPAATGTYAVPVIRELIATGKPVFGICLGHQLLSLRARRQDPQDGDRPSRRQPSRERPRHRQGRDHQPEPRLRGAGGDPAPGRGEDPREPVRRLHRGHPPCRQARVQRAVPPGGLARPPGQPLPVRALRRDDGDENMKPSTTESTEITETARQMIAARHRP